MSADIRFAGFKRMILLRHAITDLAGKLCGQLDPPLNEAGHLQVAEVAKRLGTRKIERIYSSDLRRALETAEGIAGALGLTVFPHSSFREISFGDWEGLRWADVRARFPEQTQRWLEPSSDGQAPNGESLTQFRHRVSVALAEIAAQTSDQITLVVTHLGVIRTALVDFAGLDSRSESLRNIGYGSGYEFDVSTGPSGTELPNLQVFYIGPTTEAITHV
jgi:broad specificity phosphatase PhoE